MAALAERLAAFGLDRVHVADAAAWDERASPTQRSEAVLPGARAVLVVSSSGGWLWERFVADLRADPRRLSEELHPLDAFVRRAVGAADGALGAVPRRWVFLDAEEPVTLDARRLAELAGVGVRSRLGLLLHPEAGPWIAVRAFCFLAAPLPSTPPPDFAPCEGCDACARACPGAAFPGGAFDVGRCVAVHRASDVCDLGCASRRACPVGRGHAYPPDAERYHANRRLGRRALRRIVGLPDAADRFEGLGPFPDRPDGAGA